MAHKAICVLGPQTATREEWLKMAGYSYEKRHTMMLSLDDAKTVIDGGNGDSYIKLAFPAKQADVAADLTRTGYRWVPLFDGPMDGLQLGRPFAWRYVLTSPFNAPRDYGNGRHEGADYDIIGGQPDNKVNLLCMYDGVVDISRDGTTGYGKQVRVKSERNGQPFYVRYAHLDGRFVNVGDAVAQGDALGELGATGNANGEHVHVNLEVPGYGLSGYVVADVVNPAPYIPSGAELPLYPGAGTTIDLTRFKIANQDCWRVVVMTRPDGSTHSEDVQDMDLGGGMFVRRKGNNGEWHKVDGQFFYLIHDTSPDKDSQGNDRVYSLYKDGKAGAPKSKLLQAVNETWVEPGAHVVQFRSKSSCLPLPENSGTAVNSSRITRYERNYTFNRYGQNLTFDEVVWEKTGVETQIYGRKDNRSCGWIGWESPWGESEPVEIHWDRGRLTQEPKRWCNW